MIVHKKMQGLGTKKDELFGIFRRGGFSSKVDFIDHMLEEIKIRKDNNQNLIIYLIVILKIVFNFKRFLKSLKKKLPR